MVKFWPPSFFSAKGLLAISACFANSYAAMGCPWLFTAIAAACSSATMITGRLKDSWPETVSPPSLAAHYNSWAFTFIAANSPQAKGRVERLWGVLQDRLTSELRLAQASDMVSANAVLLKLIADYNRRFGRLSREKVNAWRVTPQHLERICCPVHERIVSNDNVVQWEGDRFQIPQQARRFSFAGAKVQIHQALNGQLSFYYGDTRLQHSALPAG